MIDISPKGKKQFDAYISVKRKLKGDSFFTKDYMQQELSKSWNEIEIAKHTKPEADLYDRIYTVLSFTANDILDYAIYARYNDGLVSEIVNGLYTYERLHYLANIAKAQSQRQRYGGADSYYAKQMLLSAAANDLPALYAYTEAIPVPPTEGYRLFNAMAVGLYALLESSPTPGVKGKDILAKVLNSKTLGKWDRAVLSGISSIIARDAVSFTKSLDVVLDLYSNSKFATGLQEVICLPAHALFNLAYSTFTKDDLTPPAEPAHEYWDTQFWHHLKAVGEKREYIADIHRISPILAEWMDELPQHIDLDLILQNQ